MSSRKEFPSCRRTRSELTLDFIPGVRLEQISSLGLVFSAGISCETGASLALGIHLPGAEGDSASTFLKVQGLVVDCRPVETGAARDRHRITLLFHGLTKRQITALAQAAATATATSVSPWSPPVAPPFSSGVSFSGFDGFPPVCGLN